MFIIDSKGILRHYSVSDLSVGQNVEEVYRLVEALQYADVYGEVCPAGWKKGEQTIKESHEAEQTKDYWQNVHANKS